MEDKLKELIRRIEDHEKRLRELEKSPKPETGKQELGNEERLRDVVGRFKALDLSEFGFIYQLSGLHLFLAVLYVAKERLGLDGLAPTEIASICREKLRVSKGVDRTTIGGTLRGAGANVDRIENPRGTGFAYRITRVGEELVEQSAEKTSQ